MDGLLAPSQRMQDLREAPGSGWESPSAWGLSRTQIFRLGIARNLGVIALAPGALVH